MTSPSPADPRPLFAIVSGHYTPYRIAFHRRIAAELPGLRLASLVTKHRTGPWTNPHLHDINTIHFDPDPPPKPLDNMTIDRGGRSLPAHILHERRTARRVTQWLNANRPAVILCAGYDELPVLAALRWASRHSVPVFLSSDSNIHGDMASGLKRIIKNFYVSRIASRYRGILVCGGPGKDFFRRYGVPDARLHVMPVEPDYSIIDTMTAPRAAELARSLGLAPDRKRLVCCCRLIAIKRVDLVIDAFKAIAPDRADWDLVIVGKGEDQPALEARAGSLLADGRVRFLGFQDSTNLAAIYKSSDALVLASDYEPWALVVNEAAAAGLAIIASDRVGAAYELVESNVNGFVFPAGDLAALTDCLRRVTAPGAAEPMQRESRRIIDRWRRDSDSIRGLRAALVQAGIHQAAQA